MSSAFAAVSFREPTEDHRRPVLLPARVAGRAREGGVEGQIGWFRRNHLVPVPEVDSFEQLSTMVDAWDAADDNRRIGRHPDNLIDRDTEQLQQILERCLAGRGSRRPRPGRPDRTGPRSRAARRGG